MSRVRLRAKGTHWRLVTDAVRLETNLSLVHAAAIAKGDAPLPEDVAERILEKLEPNPDLYVEIL